MNGDELIRRGDIFQWLCEYCSRVKYCDKLTDCVDARIIDSIPSVDAVEVRHGHWVTEEEAIEKDDYSLRDTCSVCGHCDWDCTESKNFNYCPNCGAKMDDVYQPPICGPGEEAGDG